MPLDAVNSWILALALTLPRIGAAFVILPLLAQDTVPALVRNSLFVSLGLVVVPLTLDATAVQALAPWDWPFILLKEMFIGAVLGLLFGSVFWAIGMAGGIVDTQAGSNLANVLDPIQGHQNSPTGNWLSRFAAWLFMASGGFMIFLDVLLSSYQLWPIQQLLPDLRLAASEVFTHEFNYMMTTAMLLAAPAIVLLALVDFSFGLINRFAPQLNVLSLSSATKAWVATGIMMLNLGMVVEIAERKLYQNQSLLNLLKHLF